MLAKKEVYLVEANELNDAEDLADPASVETAPSPTIMAGATDNKATHDAGRKKQAITHQMVSWFAACARCSFFLAAYQLENNGDHSQATDSNDTGWLDLGWNQSVCILLRKSYGSQLDMDCYHYEGMCPECQRQYVYHAADDESTGRFQIELRPSIGS